MRGGRVRSVFGGGKVDKGSVVGRFIHAREHVHTHSPRPARVEGTHGALTGAGSRACRGKGSNRIGPLVLTQEREREKF